MTFLFYIYFLILWTNIFNTETKNFLSIELERQSIIALICFSAASTLFVQNSVLASLQSSQKTYLKVKSFNKLAYLIRTSFLVGVFLHTYIRKKLEFF